MWSTCAYLSRRQEKKINFDYTCCNLVLCTCGASPGCLSIKRGAIFYSTSFVLRIDGVGEECLRGKVLGKKAGRKSGKRDRRRRGERKKGRWKTVNEEVSWREDRVHWRRRRRRRRDSRSPARGDTNFDCQSFLTAAKKVITHPLWWRRSSFIRHPTAPVLAPFISTCREKYGGGGSLPPSLSLFRGEKLAKILVWHTYLSLPTSTPFQHLLFVAKGFLKPLDRLVNHRIVHPLCAPPRTTRSIVDPFSRSRDTAG